MQNHAFSIVAAVLTVSFVTAAQSEAPGEPSKPSAPPVVPASASPVVAPAAGVKVAGEVKAEEKEKKPLPFAGTQLVYGHAASVFTLAPGAEALYNPTWVHHLDVMPRWAFGDDFFVSGLFSVSQELTLSDSTSYRNEFEIADVRLSGGWKGWQEKVTGIRVAADLRLTFPTSKISLAQTRVLGVGPGVNVSKKFEFGGGLKVGYSVRPTYRFHRFTTVQYSNPEGEQFKCSALRDLECRAQERGGKRNSPFDLTHGPQVSFELNDKFSFEAAYVMSYRWLYPFTEASPLESLSRPDVGMQYINNFTLAANWQITKVVGLSLGADTIGGQLGFDGRYVFPLFNRNTTLYLDASFDVEAFVSGLN